VARPFSKLRKRQPTCALSRAWFERPKDTFRFASTQSSNRRASLLDGHVPQESEESWDSVIAVHLPTAVFSIRHPGRHDCSARKEEPAPFRAVYAVHLPGIIGQYRPRLNYARRQNGHCRPLPHYRQWKAAPNVRLQLIASRSLGRAMNRLSIPVKDEAVPERGSGNQELHARRSGRPAGPALCARKAPSMSSGQIFIVRGNEVILCDRGQSPAGQMSHRMEG